jgi:hypothetical protein
MHLKFDKIRNFKKFKFATSVKFLTILTEVANPTNTYTDNNCY